MKFRIKDKRLGRPADIKTAMDVFFHETGYEKERYIDLLRKDWPDIVGNILSVHSVPIKFINSTVLIYADHSVFSNDLMMLNDVIIQKINNRLSFISITHMKVEIRKIKWGT
jgi:hypothetical protein